MQRLLAVSLVALSACAVDPAPSATDTARDHASGDGDDEMDAGEGSEPECEEGDVDTCECDNGDDGKRVCVGGEYTSCNGCFEDAKEKTKCVAGRYAGRYAMTYTPGPAGFCGLATLFGGAGGGNWSFTIEQSGGEEFYTVGDGCLIGKTDNVDAGIVQAGAEAFANGVVMRAKITGVVDCATGELKGELRGYYTSTSFCGLGIATDDFFFKGPVSARFDPETNSFVDGVVVMREPEVPLPLNGQPGGKGTWNAVLNGDESDAGVVLGDDETAAGGCLAGKMFKDFPLPDLDAGTP